MNPEESATEKPIEQTEIQEEQQTIEQEGQEESLEGSEHLETTETVDTSTDSEMLLALQNLNDIMTWNFAVQFILVGLLFFILVFTSIQAGKN